MTHPKSCHDSSALSCMIVRTTARVLAATLTGAALFVSAPARADYSACMTFCLDEHNFSYCHPICDGSAGTVGEAGDVGATESVVPTSRYCGTSDEMRAAIRVWLAERYEPTVIATMPFVSDPNVFEVGFTPYEGGENADYCQGMMTFDDACQVVVMEDFECRPVE